MKKALSTCTVTEEAAKTYTNVVALCTISGAKKLKAMTMV